MIKKKPELIKNQFDILYKNIALDKPNEKCSPPVAFKMHPLAAKKLMSPTLFTTIAFKAALLACNLVNQKLINKYEHRPTPSQPKNTITKLLPKIKNNIKIVNKLKYVKNLTLCGSCSIYLIEYK